MPEGADEGKFVGISVGKLGAVAAKGAVVANGKVVAKGSDGDAPFLNRSEDE
jgi:hypothetical protein